jgi:hypothetical protein
MTAKPVEMYRRFARMCLQLAADQARPERSRALLRDMAARWHAMATDSEDVRVDEPIPASPESEPGMARA